VAPSLRAVTRRDTETASAAGADGAGEVVALRQRAFVLLALVLLAAPAMAEGASGTGTRFVERIERVVASPTPVRQFLLLSDAHVWRVDVPASGVVTVYAEGRESAPFWLRAERLDAGPSTALLPATRAGLILPAEGAWRVTLDPAAGVAVDISITFRGSAGGTGTGAPLPFTLTPLERGDACLFPSVCLP